LLNNLSLGEIRIFYKHTDLPYQNTNTCRYVFDRFWTKRYICIGFITMCMLNLVLCSLLLMKAVKIFQFSIWVWYVWYNGSFYFTSKVNKFPIHFNIIVEKWVWKSWNVCAILYYYLTILILLFYVIQKTNNRST